MNNYDLKNEKITFVYGGSKATLPSDFITIEKLVGIIISGETLTINNGYPFKVGANSWEKKNFCKDYSLRNAIERVRKYKDNKYDKLSQDAKNYLPYVLLPGKFSYRNDESFLHDTYTSLIGIDIDSADNLQVENWTQLKNKISNDPSIVFCAISPRGKGIKAALLLDKNDVVPLLTRSGFRDHYKLIKQCVFPVLEQEWEVKLDYSQAKLSQPFYLTYDPLGYINFNAEPKRFDFNSFTNVPAIPKTISLINKPATAINSVGVYQVDNDKYIMLLKEILKSDPNSKLQIKNFLATKHSEYHYNSGLLFAINRLNREGRKFFFQVFNHYSESATIRPYLASFEMWNDYLDNNWNQVAGYNKRSLRSFFLNSGIKKLDANYYSAKSGYDFYGNKYDAFFTVNKYLSEVSEDLIRSLKPGITILKCVAGGGKSTWFEELVLKYENKNILVISIKNIVLDQQIGHFICNNEISSKFHIHKNYDSKRPVFQRRTGNIIFTTINSLYHVINNNSIDGIDLVLFDECHLLVDYSQIEDDTDSKYVELYRLLGTNNIIQIYASATPEKFITSITDLKYNFINVEVSSHIKSQLNVLYTKSYKLELYDILNSNSGCSNNLIFLNNKEEGKEMQKYLSVQNSETTYVLLNTDTRKDKPLMDIIKDEYLLTGITYIATSYISEGINFLNDEKFNVYYIDNNTTDLANVYQFINRFRKKIIEAYYLTKAPKPYKSIRDINGKRKRVYYNNDEKFPFIDEFKTIYSDTEKIQKVLNFQNTRMNTFKLKTLCGDGKFIHRFSISLDIDKKAMKYIKANDTYFNCLLNNYFDTTVKYCDYKPSIPQKFKVDKEIRTFFERKSDELDYLYSNSNRSMIDDVFQDEYDIKMIEKYGSILKRIVSQKREIDNLKIDYRNNGISPNFHDELIYETGIKFKNEIFKLKANLILTGNKLGHYDTSMKDELSNTINFVETKLQENKFIYPSELNNYLSKNILVKEKKWIGIIASHLNLHQKFMKQKKKSYRIWTY